MVKKDQQSMACRAYVSLKSEMDYGDCWLSSAALFVHILMIFFQANQKNTKSKHDAKHKQKLNYL